MKIQEHNIDSDETGYENEVYRASVKAFTYPVKDIQESKADQGVVTQVTSCGPHTPIHIPISLGVGEELILPISVFGKKDCTGATITLNYGHVEEGKEGGFYTREVSVPILTTVVCAMSFRNVDVLHSTKTIDQVPDTDDVQDWMLHPRLSVTKTKSENTFLLTFDLANEWDEVFQVSFEVYDDSPVPILTQTTLIHPNVTKRIILPITRITVPQDRVQQPIPTLPGKQFVVSEKEYHEGLSRALFWYKEEFVGGLQRRGRLVMKWVGSNNRSGYLSFRSFQMTPAVLSIIKTDVIEILGTVLEDEHVTRTNNAYTCKTNYLTRVQWKITNHSGITS
jgi:hypothetical protein